MTTKSKTKAVTKTATEKVAKPTIKSLQQEVANLIEINNRFNDLINSLEEDNAALLKYKTDYLNEVSRTSQLTSKIKELENRSIFAQILFALSKPFK